MSDKYYYKYVIWAVEIDYLQLKSSDFAKLPLELSVELAIYIISIVYQTPKWRKSKIQIFNEYIVIKLMN